MLKLLLMRHGKSDWGSAAGGDQARPLAPRGVKAARRVGLFLTATGEAPDSVVTSPAVRARSTAELAAEAGGWNGAFRVASDLYGGGPEGVLAEVRCEPSATGTLLVAGHEPTWSHLASMLTGGSRFRFPTAAVACVAFECGDWSQVAPGRGELLWFVTPKLLKGVAEG